MATGKEFQDRCRALADIAVTAAVVLVVGIVAEVTWQGIVKRLVGAGGDDFRKTVHAVGVELVQALPAILIAFALVNLENLFRRMSQGAVMDAANARDLARCGNNVIAAAIAALAVTPSILGWITEGPGGARLDFEWVSVALLLLGCALTLFADVLRDAAAARAELDQIV